MVDVIRAFDWNFVSTIASDTEYGRSGIDSFKQAVNSQEDHRICIAVDEVFTVRTPKSILVSEGFDIKYYPGRNSELFRRPRKKETYSSRCPAKLGIRITNLTLYASYMVLLAGDVCTNPGPASDTFPRVRGLKVGHLNIRSVASKMDSLRQLLQENPFDVFILSETWLHKDILDPEIQVPGYTFVRNDRSDGRKGGGVMSFVRDGIPFRARPDLTNNIESCVIEIARPNCKKLFIWTVDLSLDDFIENLEASFQLLPSDADIFLLGDFNVNFCTAGTCDRSSKQKLVRFANLHNMVQVIVKPTRITENSSTTIDLLFVNDIHRIVDSGIIHAHLSDHSIIYGSNVERKTNRRVHVLHKTYNLIIRRCCSAG